MIVIIKHIFIEGPGTIGEFFENRNYELKIIELADKEPFPDDLTDINAVIILGGPMNVYEEEKFPFFKGENEFPETSLGRASSLYGSTRVARSPLDTHGRTILSEAKDLAARGRNTMGVSPWMQRFPAIEDRNIKQLGDHGRKSVGVHRDLFGFITFSESRRCENCEIAG